MRKMRWLIPMFALILSSLACFATAGDEDDSSVPMSSDDRHRDLDLGIIPLPTFTPITPYPTPLPFPTTDPAQNEAFDISTDADESGGISAVVPLVGIMGLAFGGFVGVIWYKGRQAAMRHRKSG